ncbi:hypothetical protein [Allorhodopirellula heiligendammensis]|uniref:Uncharacterized protein n=1 Tax=Allorhodopirellula heiligendammensis TaxID=2714739 RepID=A0A5C6BE56_9BACT|nr:hypothetical protein [Allorhodopirellula heiligendammensis]TWU10250.1 hypothetical protein Poly21_52210 [Allorhodopirellula heiligendammensis]
MIPTVRKDKLPRSLAYPTGAQAITDALQSAPKLDDIELWFTRNDYGDASVDGRYISISGRYRMINHGMSAAQYLVDSEFYGPTWDILVYATPREFNARIRDALRSHGFDLIREWFAEIRSDLWLSSSHRCTLWFCPEQNLLLPVKSDN